MYLKILPLLITLLLCSCTSNKSIHDQRQQRSYDLMNTVYFRYTAEVKALQLQAYNVAKDSLKNLIKKPSKLPKAVVLDLDETILDNSPYQVRANVENLLYPTGWLEWTKSAKAELIPGAKDFIDYAQKMKVAVWVITNRGEEEKEATVKNLNDKKIQLSAGNILFKQGESSKEARRLQIAKNYSIIMEIGDNLADVDVLYDKRTLAARDEATEKLKETFGRQYIVLPNPMYGDWEGAVYDWKFPKTAEEKDQVLKDFIKKHQ